MPELFYRLIQVGQAKEANRFKLNEDAGQVTVGRSAGNAIQGDCPTVAERHAQFVHRDGAWWVEFTQSSHGTLVNDLPIQREQAALAHGDRIRCGQLEVVFFNPRPISPETPQIWLASASPRRRELLAQVGLAPIVKQASIPEFPREGEAPGEYTTRLAREKGAAVLAKLSRGSAGPDWLLAADTVVVLDGQILEKPADAKHARAMLAQLSGRTHEVMTGCWISAVGAPLSAGFLVRTRVRFRPLSAETIARYVDTGEPMDKAGSYGIQGIAGAFVAQIEGSYANVVGLPIGRVVEVLSEELGALTRFPFSSTPAG